MANFESLFAQCKPYFGQVRVWQRAHLLTQGNINSLGRGTITSWLTASGQQFKDWTSSYRLFSRGKFDQEGIFSVVRQAVVATLPNKDSDIVAHLDDTLFRKSGKKVDGAKWLRDPLGPPFQSNLVWGQRFLQVSISAFTQTGPSQAVSVPVDIQHCPVVPKLSPWEKATEEEKQNYLMAQKKEKLSKVGAEKIALLRKNLNQDGHGGKKLIVSVDGGYTNERVFRGLPDNVVLIGRVRKDCKLFSAPTQQEGKGRKRVYGEAIPSPEEIRQSDQYPWQQIRAWAVGKIHEFDVKIIRNIRWRKTGPMNLQLVVIRPIAYRPTKKSRLLYRQPAYLLCTDSELEPEKLLQAYLWRWGIEVNFKEQKSLLGCGKAQVRKKDPCQKVPAFLTAVYSMILLVSKKNQEESIPRPLWYSKKKKLQSDCTTGDAINIMKAMNWSFYQNINFSHFVELEKNARSRKNYSNPLLAAVFYNRK